MGVGDEVPAALEQLGVKLSMITPDELAWGDLSKYDVIMTGVRAYERRADLRAYNQRLLDYASGRRHGDRSVQQVRVQRRAVRPVSRQGRPRARDRRERGDEAARIRAIPCSTRPTRSAAPTGRAGCRSAACISSTRPAAIRNTRISIEFTEPFPYNQGTKRGALVEAKVGQGRWIYVGLGLWRQLPAGTDGAFRLMANLLSLP